MALIKSVRGFTPEIGENCFLADKEMIAVYGLAPYCAVTSILYV